MHELEARLAMAARQMSPAALVERLSAGAPAAGLTPHEAAAAAALTLSVQYLDPRVKDALTALLQSEAQRAGGGSTLVSALTALLACRCAACATAFFSAATFSPAVVDVLARLLPDLQSAELTAFFRAFVLRVLDVSEATVSAGAACSLLPRLATWLAGASLTEAWAALEPEVLSLHRAAVARGRRVRSGTSAAAASSGAPAASTTALTSSEPPLSIDVLLNFTVVLAGALPSRHCGLLLSHWLQEVRGEGAPSSLDLALAAAAAWLPLACPAVGAALCAAPDLLTLQEDSEAAATAPAPSPHWAAVATVLQAAVGGGSCRRCLRAALLYLGLLPHAATAPSRFKAEIKGGIQSEQPPSSSTAAAAAILSAFRAGGAERSNRRRGGDEADRPSHSAVAHTSDTNENSIVINTSKRSSSNSPCLVAVLAALEKSSSSYADDTSGCAACRQREAAGIKAEGGTGSDAGAGNKRGRSQDGGDGGAAAGATCRRRRVSSAGEDDGSGGSDSWVSPWARPLPIGAADVPLALWVGAVFPFLVGEVTAPRGSSSSRSSSSASAPATRQQLRAALVTSTRLSSVCRDWRDALSLSRPLWLRLLGGAGASSGGGVLVDVQPAAGAAAAAGAEVRQVAAGTCSTAPASSATPPLRILCSCPPLPPSASSSMTLVTSGGVTVGAPPPGVCRRAWDDPRGFFMKVIAAAAATRRAALAAQLASGAALAVAGASRGGGRGMPRARGKQEGGDAGLGPSPADVAAAYLGAAYSGSAGGKEGPRMCPDCACVSGGGGGVRGSHSPEVSSSSASPQPATRLVLLPSRGELARHVMAEHGLPRASPVLA